MAASALTHSQTGPSYGPIRLADAVRTLQASPRQDVYASIDEPVSQYMSSQATLGAARAGMTAIGLEATAALCLYGAWQLWQIFR